MGYVRCEIRPGLRESEVGVTVRDIDGRPQRLRTERDFLRREGDAYYLPVGIVGRHPTEDKVLIEFPHEADSGANRCWVHPGQLLSPARRRTGEEIRREGLAALRDRLGRAGMIQFLQQFDTGSGDYASERHEWVDRTTLDDIRKAAGLATKPSKASKRARRKGRKRS